MSEQKKARDLWLSWRKNTNEVKYVFEQKPNWTETKDYWCEHVRTVLPASPERNARIEEAGLKHSLEFRGYTHGNTITSFEAGAEWADANPPQREDVVSVPREVWEVIESMQNDDSIASMKVRYKNGTVEWLSTALAALREGR